MIAGVGVELKASMTGNPNQAQVADALQYASWVLSLVTNLATTSLIGYKAWSVTIYPFDQ